jgi:hypothetical protein
MAFKVTINAVDKTSLLSQATNPQVTMKQNERSQATLSFIPGYVPARFQPIVIYDIDGVTPVFGGLVMQCSTEAIEQGSLQHSTHVQCSDYMVYADWSFWTKTYVAPVTLKTVLQNLITDKLGAYGITLDAAQDNGDTFAPFTIGVAGVGVQVSQVLRNLATACNPPRVIQMTPGKAISIVAPGSGVAPFNISDANPHCIDLEWEHSTFTPTNKIILICGPTGTGTPQQTWTANGVQTSWEVDIKAVVGGWFGLVTVGGVPYGTVSAPGQGGYFYWDETVGRGTLSVGTGSVPPNGTVLEFKYTAQYPFTVTATSGASPVIEQQFSDPDELSVTSAQARVNGLLAQLNQSPRDATILTKDRGWAPNQALTVTLTAREITAATFAISQVSAEFMEFYTGSGPMWIYTLSASETTVYQGSYLDQMRELLGGGGGASAPPPTSTGTGGVTGSGIAGTLAKWTSTIGLTNGPVAADLVVTTGSYADPAWLTTLSASKLTGTIPAATLAGRSLADLGTRSASDLSSGNVPYLRMPSGSGTWTANPTISGTLTVSGVLATSGMTVTGHLIPTSADTYDLGDVQKNWRIGYISQMTAVLFIKETQTLYGGWLAVTKNAGVFPAAVASGATTIDFGQSMTLNQFVLIRALDTGGAVTSEYLKVGSLVSGTTYNVTRNLSGIGAKNWPTGTPYAVRGVAGDGWIELNAYDTPRLSIFTQGSLYNNSVENVRLGHLTGMPNGSTGIGAYIGDATNYFRFDSTNFRVKTAGIQLDDTGLYISPVSSSGSGTFANENCVRWTTDTDLRTAIWRSDESTAGARLWHLDHRVNDVMALTLHETYLDDPGSTETAWCRQGCRLDVVSSPRAYYQVSIGSSEDTSKTTFLWMRHFPSGTYLREVMLGVGQDATISTSGSTLASPTLTCGLKITPSTIEVVGGQFQFPATQNASSDANTLDDYEEGTWTPALASTGGGAATYTTQIGNSIKVGRLVIASFNITLATKGTLAAGTVTITGLPFTSNATYYGSCHIIGWANLTTAVTNLPSYVAPSSSAATLQLVAAAAATPTNVTVADLGATTVLVGTMTYMAAN